MSQKVQLVLQAAENGNRRAVPGFWTPRSTIAEVMETMQSELSGVSMEDATMRYLQSCVPQSKWFKTTLQDMGLTQGGRALLILKLGHPGPNTTGTSDGQVEGVTLLEEESDLEKALQLLFDSNFDADSKVCIVTIMKILDNLLQKPMEPKVRSIRMANKAFAEKIAGRKGGVDVLIACGFEVINSPPSILSQMDTGDECLVLTQEKECTQHLAKARRLLMTKAIEELNMKAEELPKYKPPPRLTNAMSIESHAGSKSGSVIDPGFDPYQVHRFDAKSAAAGQNLGPDGDYISPTEQQLEALRSAQKVLENSFHKPIVDREIVATLPNANPSILVSPDASASDATIGGPSDGSLLAKQFQKREQDRRRNDEQGFTTKAMRDLEKLKKQKVYSHVQLRIQFPDGSALDAKFLPKESIEVVKGVVKESFLVPLDFDLYVAPPRRKLNDASTLEQESLVPAAKVFLSWNSAPPKGAPTGTFLKPDLFREGGAPAYPSATPIASDESENRTATKNKSTDDGDKKPNREDELLRRMLGKGPRGEKSKGGKSSNGAKPAWFKG